MRAYGLGWRLVFVAGFFSAIAGVAMLARPWWPATLGQNAPWNSQVLCGVNLAMSGATISVVARRALRDGASWAGPFLWVLVFWVGVNDVVALLLFRYTTGSGLPYAAIPLALAAVGLMLHRSEQDLLAAPSIADPPRFCDQRFLDPGDWMTLPGHDGFSHRYLRHSPVMVCETVMTTRGDPAFAIELLRGPWDWWERGGAFSFQTLEGGATDQVLVPVAWYWAHVRMRISPAIALPEFSGWRLPMRFAGSFNGSASIDVYPGPSGDQIMVRGRFHEVISKVPGPREFVTQCHLDAESGTLPFPFPGGTGWVGLRRRIEAGAPSSMRSSNPEMPGR